MPNYEIWRRPIEGTKETTDRHGIHSNTEPRTALLRTQTTSSASSSASPADVELRRIANRVGNQNTLISSHAKSDSKPIEVYIYHIKNHTTKEVLTHTDVKIMQTRMDAFIFKDPHEEYQTAIPSGVYNLVLFHKPEMLKYQLEIERKLHETAQPQTQTRYVYAIRLSVKENYGFLRLPRQLKANETIMTLSNWISSKNGLPRDFGNATASTRKQIISIAHLLALEVQKMHRAKVSMRGSLSPQHVILCEERTEGHVRRKVIIEDFSSTHIDGQFVAPWLRSIPGNSWWDTVVQEPSDQWIESSQNDFRDGIFQADIFSMGAIFWAMCEGGTAFMSKETWWNQRTLINIGDETCDGCSAWEFFVLTIACLQDTQGNRRGIPQLITPRKIEEIIQCLCTSADRTYEHISDIGRNLGLMIDDLTGGNWFHNAYSLEKQQAWPKTNRVYSS